MGWGRDLTSTLFTLYSPNFPASLIENSVFSLTVLQGQHCYSSSLSMHVGNSLNSFSLPRNVHISAPCMWHVSQSPLRTRAWGAAAVVSTSPSSGRVLRSVLLCRSHHCSPLSGSIPFPRSPMVFPAWFRPFPPHFLLPLEHLHDHIWCLLQGFPGKQVAYEGRCQQVSPGWLMCVAHLPWGPSWRLLS